MDAVTAPFVDIVGLVPTCCGCDGTSPMVKGAGLHPRATHSGGMPRLLLWSACPEPKVMVTRGPSRSRLG